IPDQTQRPPAGGPSASTGAAGSPASGAPALAPLRVSSASAMEKALDPATLDALREESDADAKAAQQKAEAPPQRLEDYKLPSLPPGTRLEPEEINASREIAQNIGLTVSEYRNLVTIVATTMPERLPKGFADPKVQELRADAMALELEKRYGEKR